MTVALTPKGRTTFWNVWIESEQIYAELAQQLGRSNLQALLRSLDAMIESLGGAEATVPGSGDE